jgi:hypothetical protein
VSRWVAYSVWKHPSDYDEDCRIVGRLRRRTARSARAGSAFRRARPSWFRPVVAGDGCLVANPVQRGLSSRRAGGCSALFEELGSLHGADLLGDSHHKKLVHGGVVAGGYPLGGLFERPAFLVGRRLCAGVESAVPDRWIDRAGDAIAQWLLPHGRRRRSRARCCAAAGPSTWHRELVIPPEADALARAP